nr:KamA family radical SAM protein [Dissulfurirhabdus thermomarina]
MEGAPRPFPSRAEAGARWDDWRWQMAHRLRRPGDLGRLPGVSPAAAAVLRVYPFAVTPYYLSLADWSDPADPIRRQALPDPREIAVRHPGSNPDPLAEAEHMPVPGLIHRYPDRVLVLAAATCGVLCRHCNRKRFWRGGGRHLRGARLERMAAYVAAHPEVREVILSGGDPLTLSDARLEAYLSRFRAIRHVEVLRVGTRAPVVLPMRITGALCRLLARHRPLWLNTHFNHPRELTAEAARACDRLSRAGIAVSNQTVLLRGVNDRLEVLRALFHGLQRMMVRPYYLFHCDAAAGTDHFRTSVRQGLAIMEGLWGRSGGLTLPAYVVDLPGGGGKAAAGPVHLVGFEGGEAVFRTFEGRVVRVREAGGDRAGGGV